MEENSGTQRLPFPKVGISTLELSSNFFQQNETYALTKLTMGIGRDPSNDIVINERIVSHFHAQIVREGNQFVLLHPHPAQQKTVNGLFYQGRHISGNEFFRKPLTHGDIFRIGGENGAFITLRYNEGEDETLIPVPEVPSIPLNSVEITFGRLSDNNIVLAHSQVSAHHACLVREQGTYRIHDLGSTNRVYVNAQRITNQLLRLGDEIRIGPFRFIYTGTHLKEYDESTYIRIDALHLKKFGDKKVMLINDISFAIPPRSFVALIGGSGTGKSTLMDALSGLRPAQQGLVLYNGKDYYRHLASFSSQIGYLPQDDIVHRDLTVERALYYAAKMRLPSDFTEAQIKQRINEVLDDVELAERRHLLIKKLSGGQRKRASLALELLANPSVFFLDEPTSGLDPGLERKMMFLLRKLADRGHTIVLVTHATNNINACDYVCFLAQGGRLAFFGTPNEARTYFSKTDFSEIYVALEPTSQNPNIAQEAERLFKISPEYQKHQAKLLSPESVDTNALQKKVKVKPTTRMNPWKQFLLLSMRYVELLKNDVGSLLLLLLQAPVVGLLLLLLAQFEIGTGLFNVTNIAQCPTKTQILTSFGLPNIVSPPNKPNSVSCDRVNSFLYNDPNGEVYAADRGGVSAAMQDFIIPGPGIDAQKLLFILAFSAVMLGCINGAREIVKEAPIYQRERAVNLGIVPYLFSKIVVLGALCLLQSAVLVVIINAIEPFQQGIFLPPILEVYITLALTSLAGLMLGLTISALAPNSDRASIVIPLILIPQVIFSGTIFPLKDWFIQMLGMLFAARWSIAALGSSQGLHSDKLGGDKLFGNTPTFQGTLFSIYSQADATRHLLVVWSALVVMIVLLTCATACFLKSKDVRK